MAEEISKDHVVKVISKNGYCDFENKELHASRGDNVTFVNATSYPVSIMFVEQQFFEAMFLNLQPQEEHTLAVSMDGAATSCECRVNCNTGAKIQFYTSKPVIIIYR